MGAIRVQSQEAIAGLLGWESASDYLVAGGWAAIEMGPPPLVVQFRMDVAEDNRANLGMAIYEI